MSRKHFKYRNSLCWWLIDNISIIRFLLSIKIFQIFVVRFERRSFMIKTSTFSLYKVFLHYKVFTKKIILFNIVEHFRRKNWQYILLLRPRRRGYVDLTNSTLETATRTTNLVSYRYGNSRYPCPGSVLSLQMPEYTDVANKALSESELASGR